MKAADRPAARICLPSTRAFSRKVFECGLYEAQDVLCAVDNVDRIDLRATDALTSRHRWLSRLVFHDPSHRLQRLNPGLEPIRLTRDYELFVTFCPSYEELLYLNAIDNWKDRCKVLACWVDEIWVSSIEKYHHWLPLLAQFDHLFVTHEHTASALSTVLGREVVFLPAAVDTLRFAPLPHVARGVGAYSIGRRREGLHQALLEYSRRNDFFYVHDTYRASVADVYDPGAHRDLFAQTAKRSQFFVVAPPKFDSVVETAGQVEVGYRFYEGAAAGCVLIGERADSEAFRRLFAWADVVTEMAGDGSDCAAILTELRRQPEHLDLVSRRNAALSLMRNDWAHRWQALLEHVGMTAAEPMRLRMRSLADRAALLDAGFNHHVEPVSAMAASVLRSMTVSERSTESAETPPKPARSTAPVVQPRAAS